VGKLLSLQKQGRGPWVSLNQVSDMRSGGQSFTARNAPGIEKTFSSGAPMAFDSKAVVVL